MREKDFFFLLFQTEAKEGEEEEGSVEEIVVSAATQFQISSILLQLRLSVRLFVCLSQQIEKKKKEREK